jgi:hypothetical protein
MKEGKNSFALPHGTAAWFGRTDKDGFIHRTWRHSQGFSSVAA